MLYDFHATENKTAPGTVHATYLLSGYRRIPPSGGDAGEDVEMSLSPWEGKEGEQEAGGKEQVQEQEQGEEPAAKVVTIVPQEKLEGLLLLPLIHSYGLRPTYQPTEAKQSFIRLVSVHVYSLACAKLTVSLHSLPSPAPATGR